MAEQTFGEPIPRTATITFTVPQLELMELALDDKIVEHVRRNRFDLAEKYIAILNVIEKRLAPCGQATTIENYANVEVEEQATWTVTLINDFIPPGSGIQRDVELEAFTARQAMDRAQQEMGGIATKAVLKR